MTLFTYPYRTRRATSALDRFFNDPLLATSPRRRVTSDSVPVDLYANDDALVARYELPGVGKKDVAINLEQGVLTLEVHRPASEDDQEKARELRFRRRLRLPVEVDAERVSADLKDGVLTVTLPKAEAAKPRSITLD